MSNSHPGRITVGSGISAGVAASGISFVEVVVLVLVLGVMTMAAAPGAVNSRSVALTEASWSLGQAIATATRVNYDRYKTTGNTAGVIPVEQCDPRSFASLVGGTVIQGDATGGLLSLRNEVYRIDTSRAGPRFAGGVSYCTVADLAGGGQATFTAVACPGFGACAP